MQDNWFEPGCLIRVECALSDKAFSEWFFKTYSAIGVEKVSIAMGKLGLNIIELGINDGCNPDLHNTEGGYLYYRHSIDIYRRSPYPDREVLIEEQVTLCKLFVEKIGQQGWPYGVIGEVKQFL